MHKGLRYDPAQALQDAANRARLRATAVTLFLLACLLSLDGTGVLRTGLLCAILHESAHALVYRKLWHRWPDLTLSPFGICLQLRGVPMTPEEELRLASAGPLANLLACCTVLLYMQTAGQYSYSGYWFACTNLLGGGQSAAAAGAGRCAHFPWNVLQP